ncbi:hypothetical protein [Nocardia sp. NPDC051463]|uniref:hypothetical protein n=1 Tax=Nocardia sp. NPDC051463 TaxID=3154845 RepID=UPI00344E82C5
MAYAPVRYASSRSASGSVVPGNLGPFEYLRQGEARGSRGLENGECQDYDCAGSYGAHYLVPRY